MSCWDLVSCSFIDFWSSFCRSLTLLMRYVAFLMNFWWSAVLWFSNWRMPISNYRSIQSVVNFSIVSKVWTLSTSDCEVDSSVVFRATDVTTSRIWSTLDWRYRNSFLDIANFFFFFYLGLDVECCDPLDSSLSRTIIKSSNRRGCWSSSLLSSSNLKRGS